MEPDRPQMSPLAVTPAAWFIRNDRICAKAPSTVGQEDCPSLSARLVSADDEDPSKPMLPPATLEGGYPANMGTSWRDPTPSDSALMETLDSCSRSSRHRAHQRLLPAHVSEAHAAKKHDLAQRHLDKASAKVRQSFLSDERSFAQSMPLHAHELRKKHFWEAECESHTHRMQEVGIRIDKARYSARMLDDGQAVHVRKGPITNGEVAPKLISTQGQPIAQRQAPKSINERGNIERVTDTAKIRGALLGRQVERYTLESTR